MSAKRFLILGGYGRTGPYLSRLLLKKNNIQLIIGGRDIHRAEKEAMELNRWFKRKRVTAIAVDASSGQSLKKAFGKSDFVIVASATRKFTENVVHAAIDAGIDYLDIQYSDYKIRMLKSMAYEIKNAGRCFITEAGLNPGLPSALVRHGALLLDSLEEAIVAGRLNDERGQPPSQSLFEAVSELKNYQSYIFRSGRWKKARMGGILHAKRIDFGKPFDRRLCIPVSMEEMYRLPEIVPALKRVGFYMSGYNWFVDYFLMGFILIVLKIFPERSVRPMGRLLSRGIGKFSRAPWGAMLKADLKGKHKEEKVKVEISLFHRDPLYLTAAAAVASINQYLDGIIKEPGLHIMGQVVDTGRLFADLVNNGIELKIKHTTVK